MTLLNLSTPQNGAFYWLSQGTLDTCLTVPSLY